MSLPESWRYSGGGGNTFPAPRRTVRREPRSALWLVGAVECASEFGDAAAEFGVGASAGVLRQPFGLSEGVASGSDVACQALALAALAQEFAELNPATGYQARGRMPQPVT